MTIDNSSDNLKEAVSIEEAGHSLEGLANLLFLCSQAAGDAGKVSAYVVDAEQCVQKLSCFLREEMRRRRVLESS